LYRLTSHKHKTYSHCTQTNSLTCLTESHYYCVCYCGKCGTSLPKKELQAVADWVVLQNFTDGQ